MLAVGGYTYGGVWSAATLDVATTRPNSTRPRMRTRQVTLSSAASSQARIGFGTTERTNTRRGLASHPRSIIPSTNPCLDPQDGSPPTGKISWSIRDDVDGASHVPNSHPRRLSGPDALRATTQWRTVKPPPGLEDRRRALSRHGGVDRGLLQPSPAPQRPRLPHTERIRSPTLNRNPGRILIKSGPPDGVNRTWSGRRNSNPRPSPWQI